MSTHSYYTYKYTAKEGEAVLLDGQFTHDGPLHGNKTHCQRCTSTDIRVFQQYDLDMSDATLHFRITEADDKWYLETTTSLGGEITMELAQHELPKVVGETYKGEVTLTLSHWRAVYPDPKHTYNVIVTLLEKGECENPKDRKK